MRKQNTMPNASNQFSGPQSRSDWTVSRARNVSLLLHVVVWAFILWFCWFDPIRKRSLRSCCQILATFVVRSSIPMQRDLNFKLQISDIDSMRHRSIVIHFNFKIFMYSYLELVALAVSYTLYSSLTTALYRLWLIFVVVYFWTIDKSGRHSIAIPDFRLQISFWNRSHRILNRTSDNIGHRLPSTLTFLIFFSFGEIVAERKKRRTRQRLATDYYCYPRSIQFFPLTPFETINFNVKLNVFASAAFTIQSICVYCGAAECVWFAFMIFIFGCCNFHLWLDHVAIVRGTERKHEIYP